MDTPIKKTSKKKNYKSFSIYIYKVLRGLPEIGNLEISSQAMLIMNDFVIDWLEKIAVEAGRLVVYRKKTTLSIRDIQSALKLLLPPGLVKTANIEGLRAMYHNSQN